VTAPGFASLSCSVIVDAIVLFCTEPSSSASRALSGSRFTVLPFGHIQPSTLVCGALPHIGVSIGAEHIDRTGNGFVVAPLPRHESNSGLNLITDVQYESNASLIVENANALPVV
jgi:hypothetical protein